MPIIRSLFFAPANRPDLVAKFPRFGADCYVIDLEDGTPPAHKAAARAGLLQLVAGLRQKARLPGVLTVRVNEPESDHYLDDLAAALASEVDGIVIPKLETTDAKPLAAPATDGSDAATASRATTTFWIGSGGGKSARIVANDIKSATLRARTPSVSGAWLQPASPRYCITAHTPSKKLHRLSETF